MKTRHSRADAGQNYFISFNDLLVGMLFIFILLLVTYAVNAYAERRASDARLDQLEGRMEQRDKLLTALKDKLAQPPGKYKSTIIPDEGLLRLDANVLFAPGYADLNPHAKKVLDVLATAMKEELPCYSNGYSSARCPNGGGPILEAVYIEGHTDRQRIKSGPYPDNWYLSAARAFETYEHITAANGGFLERQRNASGEAALIGAVAYASTRELDKEKEVSAMNRRIDFRFLIAPASRPEIDRARAK